MPSYDEALEWARREVMKAHDSPTRERLYLLMLLHRIKKLEQGAETVDDIVRPL